MQHPPGRMSTCQQCKMLRCGHAAMLSACRCRRSACHYYSPRCAQLYIVRRSSHRSRSATATGPAPHSVPTARKAGGWKLLSRSNPPSAALCAHSTQGGRVEAASVTQRASSLGRAVHGSLMHRMEGFRWPIFVRRPGHVRPRTRRRRSRPSLCARAFTRYNTQHLSSRAFYTQQGMLHMKCLRAGAHRSYAAERLCTLIVFESAFILTCRVDCWHLSASQRRPPITHRPAAPTARVCSR